MSVHLKEAVEDHRSGRLEEAEAHYRRVLESRPGDPDAMNLLGVTLCQRGRPLDGLRLLDAAIERAPGIAAFHGNRGEILRVLGRSAEAAAATIIALELDPTLAPAQNNLGMLRLRAGRPAEALTAFDEAIRLRPGFLTPRVNRGEALLELGRLEEAADAYREVLAVDPENAWVHAYLGHVLLEMGDIDLVDEAAAHCFRAVELAPGLACSHTNLGNVLSAMNRDDEAIESYQRAIEIDSTLGNPWNNLALIEQSRGRYDQAAEAFERALECAPASPRFHANLAGLLVETERPAAAIARLRIALEYDPDFAEAHVTMAAALHDLGRRTEAIAAARRAQELRPGRPGPRLFQARILAEDGDFAAAAELAREALAVAPRCPAAYYVLSQNLRGRLGDDDLNAMEDLLAEKYLGDEGRAHLHFAMATVRDAREDYEEAARLYARGNAHQAESLRRSGRRYDPDRIARDADELIASFTPEYFRAVDGLGDPGRRPIFVVGMPRSGTTLVEQVLASHRDVFGAGELDDVRRITADLSGPDDSYATVARTLRGLEPDAARRLARRYLDQLEQIDATAVHVVDKMPANYLLLGVIATLWPEARVIVCRRDPRDVALSCWTNFFAEIRWANDLGHIAGQIAQCDRLIAHWYEVLPRRPIEVVYEDFVADFEPQARRLLEALELPWDSACLEFHSLRRPVMTASLGQVRQPIYTRSVGRWRHYSKALEPLLRVLAEFDRPSASGPVEAKGVGAYAR